MRSTAIRPHVAVRHTVRAGDLASAWGNELPVLATPVLLWWAELAAMQAMEPAYEPGEMCVGARHEDVHHVAASLEGHEIEVVASLLDHDRDSARFAVTATDGNRTVFRGVHVRGVVDRTRFVARLEQLGSAEGCCLRKLTDPVPGQQAAGSLEAAS